MRAKLKAGYWMNAIRACGGEVFVKDEFRTVPPEHEAAALNNPDLEIEQEAEAQPAPEPAKKRGRK